MHSQKSHDHQLDDLIRELEGACVTEFGPQVLKELKQEKLASNAAKNPSSKITPQRLPSGLFKRYCDKHMWRRAVSWPEIIFSVFFSLILACANAIWQLG